MNLINRTGRDIHLIVLQDITPTTFEVCQLKYFSYIAQIPSTGIRMKTKINLEYTLNASPRVLYPRISTAAGLAEWFADDVHVRGKIYTFFWNNTEQQAEMVMKKDQKYARFKWLDNHHNEDGYFEFRIHTEELTGDVALLITDFVEEDEKEDAIELWNTQIANLRHVMGL
mgnify:CR=1 FL=1